MRRLSLFDSLLNEIDTALRTLAPPKSRASMRASPATNTFENPLSTTEKNTLRVLCALITRGKSAPKHFIAGRH